MATHPETLPCPPRWAESFLRACLSPADRDAVSGDLLEEYRDTVRPSRGRLFGADAWYLRRVAGVLGGLLWPGLILLAVPVTGLAIALIRGDALGFFDWLPRALPAPGVSLLDAVIYTWAAYYASRRTRLLRTGLMAAAVCSFVNLALLFIALDLKFGLLQTMFCEAECHLGGDPGRVPGPRARVFGRSWADRRVAWRGAASLEEGFPLK